MAAAQVQGRDFAPLPATTALGALFWHITGGADSSDYQPMNVNFGLFPPLAGRVRKKERKQAYTARARADMAEWLS